MARRLFVAGNWKMNTTLAEATALAGGLVKKLASLETADVAVCPPFVYLQAVRSALAGSRIALGAQNMFTEAKGAYTGEISGAMLKDVGCRYVILGHSERRQILCETDQTIRTKIAKALADGLEVIFCVGETLAQRQEGATLDVVGRQVKIGLEAVSKADMPRVTVAYEPVWAIGTGVTATPDQAQEVHAAIRGLLGGLYGAETAQATRIQYGGSVTAANAATLMAQPDIDGALVGGASLKIDDFAAIAMARK